MKTKIGSIICKLLQWWGRGWSKTSRGKWHIVSRDLPLRGDFVPVCMPQAIWNAIEATKHTSPKDEAVCKLCAAMMKDGSI